MPNSKSTLPMNHEHLVPTPGVGKPTKHYESGLAEIRDQPDLEDMGPQHRSLLDKSEVMSTGHDLSR